MSKLINFRKMNIEKYSEHIKFLVESRKAAVKANDLDYNPATMIWGWPGIGKSQVIRDMCKKFKWEFFDLRLSQIDPTDLRGVPFYDEKTNTADFRYYTSVLPDPNSKKSGIILLDELPLAAEMILSAAYQLVHDRKVGSYTVPINFIVLAAGNPQECGGGFFEMPPALKNRFDHILLDIDYSGFVQYMMKKQYDEIIVSFLAANSIQGGDNEKLYKFEPDCNTFPTFRSWEKAAKKIKYGCDLVNAIVDSVGQAAAIEVQAFKELTKDIPDAATLMKNKIYYPEIEKQLVAMQKVGNVLANDDQRNKLKDNNEKFEYFKYFIDMHNPEDTSDQRTELTILFLSNIKDNFDLLDEVDAGYRAQVKTGKFKIPKNEKLENFYKYIAYKWSMIDMI